MQVMLSSQGVSVETRRSLETFSEFAFLCLATQRLHSVLVPWEILKMITQQL
jgi:hypothetical protein